MTAIEQRATIRPVQREDFARWLPLWKGYQSFYQVELPDAVTATTWERFFDMGEPVHALVAESGDQLAGLAHYLLHHSTWSVAPRCYLNDLFVSPDRRRQGIAEALIRAASTDAQQRGAGKVYWLTHESNVAARRLYDRVAERSGFLQYSLDPTHPAD